MLELGKLEKINDLRSVWPHEEKNFSKWLIQENNLDMLSEAIGIDIEFEEIESPIGEFNADILAIETDTNNKIIIENQLEDTDHNHLGKIITYASGKNASFIIWIVKRARDEHRKAIEWLNSNTDEQIGFFLVEIELWKIDNSKIAPKFNVVEKPNNWAKELKLSESLSDIKKLQLDFWNKFKEYASHNESFMNIFNLRKAYPHALYNLSCGISQCRITFAINSLKNFATVGIYIQHNKELTDKLINKIPDIESLTKKNVQLNSGKKDNRIFISKEISIHKQENWDDCFDWFCKNSIIFYNIVSDID